MNQKNKTRDTKLNRILSLKQKDMNLKEQINADFMAAFKAKEMVKKNYLGVIKGEIQNAESRGETDVMAILKANKKNLIKSIEMGDESAKVELEFIEVYMPKMMSETETENVVATIISETGATSMKDMGRVMGELNKRFAGQVDGKIASTFIKKLLS